MKPVTHVGVVGVGQMGSGIAQVAAMAGFSVLLFDANAGQLDRAVKNIEKSLGKFVEKQKISTADRDGILKRLKPTSNLSDFASVNLVIEAIVESEDLKKKVFTELNGICTQDTIFASNTSTIPIGRLAASVSEPSRFIGMHFMNPVPLMKLVEVIRGFHTSDETLAAISEVAKRMEKTIVVSKDFPGFIVNRVLMPMINEAIFALQEGVATAEEIDTAMKLGTNQPMGPLTLADFIGLDTCLYIMEVMHKGLGEAKYRPAPLLRQYVEAGLFGKKSGRGFYTYA